MYLPHSGQYVAAQQGLVLDLVLQAAEVGSALVNFATELNAGSAPRR